MKKIKLKAKEAAESKYKKKKIQDDELIDVFEGMEPPQAAQPNNTDKKKEDKKEEKKEATKEEKKEEKKEPPKEEKKDEKKKEK